MTITRIIAPDTIQCFNRPELYAHFYGRVIELSYNGNDNARIIRDSFVGRISLNDEKVIISEASSFMENSKEIIRRKRLWEMLHGFVPFYTDRLGTTYGVADEGAVAVTEKGVAFFLDEWFARMVHETRRYTSSPGQYFKLKPVPNRKGLSLKSLK